jgi:hypothetical protein
MHVVPAHLQDKPHQVRPMWAPAQIFSSLLGRGFSAPASANERAAPNAILPGPFLLTAEISGELRVTMIPDRSFEISGTKPLSKA